MTDTKKSMRFTKFGQSKGWKYCLMVWETSSQKRKGSEIKFLLKKDIEPHNDLVLVSVNSKNVKTSEIHLREVTAVKNSSNTDCNCVTAIVEEYIIYS